MSHLEFAMIRENNFTASALHETLLRAERNEKVTIPIERFENLQFQPLKDSNMKVNIRIQ